MHTSHKHTYLNPDDEFYFSICLTIFFFIAVSTILNNIARFILLNYFTLQPVDYNLRMFVRLA